MYMSAKPATTIQFAQFVWLVAIKDISWFIEKKKKRHVFVHFGKKSALIILNSGRKWYSKKMRMKGS